MNKLRQFFVNYAFIVIPATYVVATILMDIAIYWFMGLSFPSRYYFSIVVMFSICGLLFFIKKPSVQYGICIFLLAVHFAVGVANIILFDQANEIVSLESLSAVRQVTTLTDFIILDLGYMMVFSLIVLAFIFTGIWIFSVIGRNKKRYLNRETNKYRRNLALAIVTLSITAYLTGFLHLTLPQINIEMSQAYDNYNNDRFIYSTFTNRTKVLQEFGTYSYYWSNISLFLGLKQEYTYDIPSETTETFTFQALDNEEQNVIMLMMETLEDSLVNPLIMPNLYDFLYNDNASTADNVLPSGLTTSENTVKFQGLYSVDRTTIAEYSSLAGVHLDGVEMNTMPQTTSPFALPNILKRTRHNSDKDTQYTSIKAFHNYYSYMYNRDKYFKSSLGFDEYISLLSTPPSHQTDMVDSDAYDAVEAANGARHFNNFNMNSDYKMFESQVEKMAPVGEKFFTWVLNISTHMPYYDTKLFNHYKESGDAIISNIDELKYEFANLNSPDQRTREAVLSYLTGAYEYDRGLGILFNHLRDNNQLDKTTIVFYGDHYNNASADLLAPTTAKTTIMNPTTSSSNGRMLAYYIYSPAFENPSTNPEIIYKNDEDEIIKSYENPHLNVRLGNPNLTPGNSIDPNKYGIITKFFNHYDIYATVCDILHIKTNSKYTLGISAFDSHENIGFSVKTGLVFNNKYATENLIKFKPGSIVPNETEIAAAKSGLSHQLAVMNNLRPLFRNDNLPEDSYYIITS